MTRQLEKNREYDLKERTALLGEAIITFAEKVARTPVTTPIIIQLVKAGTSIGANYCEADSAESRKDFEHKIGICKKESKETKFWLRMVQKAAPHLTEEAQRLSQEAHELLLIFVTIAKNSKQLK